MTALTKWTPERIAELRKLAELGFSTVRIARMMNTTMGSVSATCFKHGIKTKGKRPNGQRHQMASKAEPISLPGPDWTKRP